MRMQPFIAMRDTSQKGLTVKAPERALFVAKNCNEREPSAPNITLDE